MKFKLQSLFICLTIVILCATIGLVWFGYIKHTSDRLYFSITQFDLPSSKSFTIGENSDICYKGVPENYMTAGCENENFSYQINKTDSCLYYKINNKNPNSHKIEKESIITAFGVELTGDSIFRRLKKFDNEYYMLSDVLKDRIKQTTLKQIESGEIDFNSFIQKKNDNYNLIILDKYTKFNDNGYCYANTLLDVSEFKIQFFKMRSWSVKKADDNYFCDSVRNYYAKPIQLFTEWGAGHITITRSTSKFSITFPKAITTIIPTEKIKETAESSEAGVYLKQMLKSYPMPTDFYIPAFSNALPEYLCELTPDKLLFQESNRRDTVALQTSGSFVPSIDIKTQQLELGSITYKSRILNSSFYWSKHYLLFISWLVLSVILFLSFPVSGTEKVKDARWYIWGMFTLFWFFLNQKLLIAGKLTFTYPYFEKIYPVSYLTTLFSLFALFLLIIRINRAYFSNKKLQYLKPVKLPQYLRFKKWQRIPITVKFTVIQRIIFTVLVLCAMYYVVGEVCRSFIAPIWNSYIGDDISGLWKIWRWQKIDFLNDNHFTVFMIVGVLLVALLLVFLILTKPINKINQGRFVSKLKKKGNDLTQKIDTRITTYLKEQNGFKRKIKYVFKFVKQHFKIILFSIIYVVLAVVIDVLGNFGTALAVLILVFSLSILFQKQIEKSYNKSFLWLLGSLAIACCFVVIGMSDFGFFINVFGVVFCWIILMLSATKYYEKKKRWKNFVRLLALGIIACFIVIQAANLLSNPEKIGYDRSTRRIENYIDPDKVKEAGYLYTESDMQWMEVMRHYAEKVKTGRGDDYDIYSEDNNFHQLVSSGQSPVILNDVCVPGVYLGVLRGWGWFGLLFGVVALGALVFWFSIGDTWRQNPQNFIINRQLIGRLLAGNLWIGVTLYLLASYYWKVPFTGRLIPGFGVDAVGEALEIIVLFAFMCALCNPFNQNKK